MLFDCDKPERMEMKLLVTGGCIEKGSSIIAISNYVMDSLLTDAIRIIPDSEKKVANVYLARLSVYISDQIKEALGDRDPYTQPDLLPKYDPHTLTHLDTPSQGIIRLAI